MFRLHQQEQWKHKCQRFIEKGNNPVIYDYEESDTNVTPKPISAPISYAKYSKTDVNWVTSYTANNAEFDERVLGKKAISSGAKSKARKHQK